MNHQDQNNRSRRSMLKAMAGSCGLMTNTSLLATLLNLQATKSAVASDTDTSGYKAIVCLFLAGGNDSYNMLVPNEDTEFTDYESVRGGYHGDEFDTGGLALNRNTLIPIAGPDSRSFGFHEAMAGDADPNASMDPGSRGAIGLYNQGNLGVVANVGSLIERTDRADYSARRNLPAGLFSHADLQRHWMTGIPQSRAVGTGWGGRLADLMISTNSNPSVSMNISLDGSNLFQTGGSVIPYTIGNNGATRVNSYTATGGSFQNQMFNRAADNFLDQTYNNLLEKSFANTTRSSIDAAIAFDEVTSSVELDTPFDAYDLSQELEMVARVIGARNELGQTRQVFFVSQGGWDNHGNLFPNHALNLDRVSKAMASFYAATEELGVADDVVTFTASDFARTLSSNGQGSDHAWGGNHLIMGGGVQGGQFYGQFPESLANGNPLDLGRGRLLPTTSVDEIIAELACWFGVGNNSDLEAIVPNIRNFYSDSQTGGPLGILNA